MERITMSLDEDLAQAFDSLIRDRGYTSRSEAMRDLLRRETEAHRQTRYAKAWCVGSLSYVYDHHLRDLSKRLTAAQHEHHDLVIATTHVHLDHENCLETVILRGPTSAVRKFANALQAERGVRHGQLNLISVEPGETHHGPGAHRHHGQPHLIPKS
jgi:CopG family transcriptional regulator, nickel-responsive regulator